MMTDTDFDIQLNTLESLLLGLTEEDEMNLCLNLLMRATIRRALNPQGIVNGLVLVLNDYSRFYHLETGENKH